MLVRNLCTDDVCCTLYGKAKLEAYEVRCVLNVCVHAAGTCATATRLSFEGFTGNPGTAVPAQGPLIFPNWRYDSAGPSNPPTYTRPIFSGTRTGTIRVADDGGILLCNLVLSSFNSGVNTFATITGITPDGATVTKTQSVPGYPSIVDVTFDSTWQPLERIVIDTVGSPDSVDLWEISYAL